MSPPSTSSSSRPQASSGTSAGTVRPPQTRGGRHGRGGAQNRGVGTGINRASGGPQGRNGELHHRERNNSISQVQDVRPADPEPIPRLRANSVASRDEGWTTWSGDRRRRQRRRVTGSREARVDGLQGAPPPQRHVWIARILNGNEAKIKAYIESKDITVSDIRKVSHEEAQFSSYKVSIDKSQLTAQLDGAFWPRGVVCELWRDPRRRNTNGNADQAEGDSRNGLGRSNAIN